VRDVGALAALPQGLGLLNADRLSGLRSRLAVSVSGWSCAVAGPWRGWGRRWWVGAGRVRV